MGTPRPELKRLREAKGLTIKELANLIGISPDSLGRIESGRQDPQGQNFRNYADFLGISYQRLRNILKGTYVPGDLDDSNQLIPPKKLSLFIALESQAKQAQVYAPHLIPGLLQTESYARTLIENERGMGASTENRIELRLNRQKALTRKEEPLEYRAVIYEAVLHLEVGDNGVMRGQLEHLEYLAQLPNVDLRLLPFSAGPCHLDRGGFILLTLPPYDEPNIAYQEFYDGPRQDDREDYVRILSEAFEALLAMASDADETANVISRLQRRYPT